MSEINTYKIIMSTFTEDIVHVVATDIMTKVKGTMNTDWECGDLYVRDTPSSLVGVCSIMIRSEMTFDNVIKTVHDILKTRDVQHLGTIVIRTTSGAKVGIIHSPISRETDNGPYRTAATKV